MRIFDPHIHMTSRTTDDYERMAGAGVRAIVEPAFWLGQPRTSVGSFVDYFDALLGGEPFRAGQFGIRHHCALALNPKEANDPGLARDVLAVLPRYLDKDGVVAVGEVGFDAQTPAEEAAFAAQVELAIAADLPVMVHTPHRDKRTGTQRTLDLCRAAGLPPERTLVDHLNELTVPLVKERGCWMACSVYPDTKMDEARMVRIVQEYGTERLLVNSAADWGRSDPLKVASTAAAMAQAGLDAEIVDLLVWRNPGSFFAASGRLELAPEPPQRESFAGNSLLRGERA
jgi:uncharacterized protein